MAVEVGGGAKIVRCWIAALCLRLRSYILFPSSHDLCYTRFVIVWSPANSLIGCLGALDPLPGPWNLPHSPHYNKPTYLLKEVFPFLQTFFQ